MVIALFMKLYDHILKMNEKPSSFARRLNLPVPTITRYLRGERGLSAKSLRVILEDAQGSLRVEDLVPNPYMELPATASLETSRGGAGR